MATFQHRRLLFFLTTFGRTRFFTRCCRVLSAAQRHGSSQHRSYEHHERFPHTVMLTLSFPQPPCASRVPSTEAAHNTPVTPTPSTEALDVSTSALFSLPFPSSAGPQLPTGPRCVSELGFSPFPSPVSHLPRPYLITAETRLGAGGTCQNTPSFPPLMSTAICVFCHHTTCPRAGGNQWRS